ncbi:MAG: hypothetical protein AAF039_00075 [Bacteroidota bacterium]
MKSVKNIFPIVTTVLLTINAILLIIVFGGVNKIKKFEEIDVERINIVEPDGTLKLALFSSSKLRRGLDGDKRKGAGTISGIWFYNEEGYETGGLVFDGKSISGGQNSGVSLTFDGYRQDQTIAIQHNEKKDSINSYYEDGIQIMSRPDFTDVKEEYDFYKLKYPDTFGDENTPRLTKEIIDSIDLELARDYKVAKKRIYLGNQRGDLGQGWFDNSGLYIKNKYGKDMIRIYVDKKNTPKFEVLDSLGNMVKYNLIPEIR